MRFPSLSLSHSPLCKLLPPPSSPPPESVLRVVEALAVTQRPHFAGCWLVSSLHFIHSFSPSFSFSSFPFLFFLIFFRAVVVPTTHTELAHAAAAAAVCNTRIVHCVFYFSGGVCVCFGFAGRKNTHTLTPVPVVDIESIDTAQLPNHHHHRKNLKLFFDF